MSFSAAREAYSHNNFATILYSDSVSITVNLSLRQKSTFYTLFDSDYVKCNRHLNGFQTAPIENRFGHFWWGMWKLYHNSSFWNSQAHSLNIITQDYEWVFLGILVKSCIVGMLLCILWKDGSLVSQLIVVVHCGWEPIQNNNGYGGLIHLYFPPLN